MTKQQTITKKQETIISLLFRFRFLDRAQIQKFLNHKDEARINEWLKDLTEKEYINRSFIRKFLKDCNFKIIKKGDRGEFWKLDAGKVFEKPRFIKIIK